MKEVKFLFCLFISLACNELEKICNSKDFHQEFLELCTYESLEFKQKKIAIKVLENLLFKIKNESPGQIGIILRNLLKLHIEK